MTQSLYDKYGGFAGVSRAVMAFYERVLDSDIIGDYFENVRMERLIDHQTKFMAALLGGPASFSDEHIRQAHAHLGLSHDDFDEMGSLLRETLLDSGFSSEDADFVLRAVETFRPKLVSAGAPS